MNRAGRKAKWRRLSRGRIHQTRREATGTWQRIRVRHTKTPLPDPIPSWVRTCHRYDLDVKWMREMRRVVRTLKNHRDNTSL